LVETYQLFADFNFGHSLLITEKQWLSN